MKKFFSLLIIAIILLTFTACSPANKELSDINGQLIGTWKLASEEDDGGEYGVLLVFNKNGSVLYGFDWSDFDDKNSPDVKNNVLTDALSKLGKRVRFSYKITDTDTMEIASKIFIVKTQREVNFSVYENSLTFNGYIYTRVE